MVKSIKSINKVDMKVNKIILLISGLLIAALVFFYLEVNPKKVYLKNVINISNFYIHNEDSISILKKMNTAYEFTSILKYARSINLILADKQTKDTLIVNFIDDKYFLLQNKFYKIE